MWFLNVVLGCVRKRNLHLRIQMSEAEIDFHFSRLFYNFTPTNRDLVMKRTLFILLAALCLNGCNIKIIDWVPVTFQVRVQDENGKDLLDPANDNTWLIGTHISFNGTSDTLEEGDIVPVTKAVAVIYDGVRLEKGEDYYYLAFGEFERTDYDNEVIAINWPDGTYDEITYKCRLNSVTVEAKEKFKLNGVKCSNPIVIVK